MRITCTILILSWLSHFCYAHSWESMDVDVNVDGLEWEAELLFDAGYAVPEWRDDLSVRQPKLEWLEQLSSEEHAKLRTETETYLKEFLLFSFSGQVAPCDYEFPDWNSDPPQFPAHYDNDAYFRVIIRGQLKEESGVLTLTTADGVYPQVSCVVNSQEKYLLTAGNSVKLVERTEDQRTKVVQLGLWESILGDLSYGFRHVIPDGMDHILFIVAMSLMSLNFQALLRLTFSFTLAHSITLALVSVGVISLTPFLTGLIELVIALSIVVLAASNLVQKRREHSTTLLVFIFGLIHGMGFANALSEGLSQPDGFWLRLLFTNVGIEIAQILLIIITLVCFSRVKSSYPKTITSVIILSIALFWSVERLITL